MIGTIKTVDLHSFVGLTLTKVELGEYVLKLYFGDNNRIDVEEYWEYRKQNTNQVIDRYYSKLLRKDFKLPLLVGHNIIGIDRQDSEILLQFDNQEELLILKTEDRGTEARDLTFMMPSPNINL